MEISNTLGTVLTTSAISSIVALIWFMVATIIRIKKANKGVPGKTHPSWLGTILCTMWFITILLLMFSIGMERETIGGERVTTIYIRATWIYFFLVSLLSTIELNAFITRNILEKRKTPYQPPAPAPKVVTDPE